MRILLHRQVHFCACFVVFVVVRLVCSCVISLKVLSNCNIHKQCSETFCGEYAFRPLCWCDEQLNITRFTFIFQWRGWNIENKKKPCESFVKRRETLRIADTTRNTSPVRAHERAHTCAQILSPLYFDNLIRLCWILFCEHHFD